MYAIILTGGKQYKVSEGDTIFVEKLELEDGAKVDFPVVCIGNDGDILLGDKLSSAKVSGSVVKTGKQKKIMIFKFKAKKGYRRRQGHRQPYTKIQIDSIIA